MYSWGIITDGREPQKLDALIASIHALKIPDYEIAVSGNTLPGLDVDCVIPMPHTARQGRLGALRNGVCSVLSGDVLVICDDDMLFHPDWYEGMQKFGDDFDLLSCRILNPDGTRYWDWKWHRGGVNGLLDYSETSPDVSLTGGLTIMKAYVKAKIDWNDELGFNQAEDVDFTSKAKAAGFRVAFNPHSTITHTGPYTQVGQGVMKLEAEHVRA